MFPILEAISEQRSARNWTEYQLAEKSGIPQSTISSWYRKKLTPSFASLCKICEAFGISLAEFFADGSESFPLTAKQQLLLKKWSRLSAEQRRMVFELMENMK